MKDKIRLYINDLLKNGYITETEMINNVSENFCLDNELTKEIVRELAISFNWYRNTINNDEPILGLKDGIETLPPNCNKNPKTIEEANTLNANALTDMYNVLGNIGAYPKLKTVIKNTTVKTDMSADLGYPTDEETPRPEVSIAEIVLDLVKRTEDIEKSGSNTIRNINTISNNISTLRTNINKEIKSIEEQIAYCNSTVLFRDKFYVTNNTTTQFNLTHLPIEESITFWINGVCYFDDVYTYDKDTNTVNYTENANLNRRLDKFIAKGKNADYYD